MSRAKSGYKRTSEHDELGEKKRPISAKISNSFHPQLANKLPTLPPIKNQENIHSTLPASSTIPTTNAQADLFVPATLLTKKKKSVNDLSKTNCQHLWFRRIKEIFLVMGKQNDVFTRFDMELARKDMIQTCEQYLESERPKGGGSHLNESNQKKVDRWKNKRLYAETFRMSYFRKDTDLDDKTANFQIATKSELSGGEVPNFDNAIWWYSCNEAPIFDQMNNILRLESFELLMCHRYYISDLCQMIERSYAQNKFSKKFTVYRADKISSLEFNTLENLKDQKDAPMSINGFISTSRDEKISLEYAEAKLNKQGDDVVIMYEITIDPAISCTAYADIESISFHPREREVLFSMGSTFQIDGIENDPSNPKIKRIKLTACDFNLALLDEMKAKVKQSSQATLSILLVQYLIELGEDRVSKRYLNQIIASKQLEDDPNLVAVYNCLGMIYSRQALYGEALDYYRKALNTQARLQFSNNNALAEIYNYIGQAHLGLDQLDEAQQNLEEGIRIQKREPKYTQQHLATLYCSMGQVAYARHEYDDAEENFQQSYDLYNRNTKISHDALEKRLLKADLCIAFGHLKSMKNPNDKTEAKEKFEEALDIYKSTLPSSHPKVAETHIDIVCEYARNKNYELVIQYYDDNFIELMKSYEMKHTTSQQDLASLYAVIGACFAHNTKFDTAMEVWKKSIEHEQKSFLDELLSSTRVSKIALPTQLVQSAYRIALEYYSKINDAPREYLGILYAKTYVYDKAIVSLREQNWYLLSNIYILERNFRESMAAYKRISELKNRDHTRMIGILLQILTAKNTPPNEEPISELIRIEESLSNNVTDSEAVRLRMIINDYLAQTYLSMKAYVDALQYSEFSFDLKQKHYSSNHPSLVRSCQLMASCGFYLQDYKNAIQYYEKAVEIQLDNMPSGHANVRANYFLMGDCYCQMRKLELANEFYDRAQAPNDAGTDDESEAERDVKALIRMHSNLAMVYAKQKDFFSARTSQETKIDLIKEILPAFVLEVVENDDASSIPFERLQKALVTRLGLANGKTFTQLLRNLLFIYLSLAPALLQADQRTDQEEDSTDVYEKAIGLELKLTVFENAEEKRLPKLYEELSDAYAKLYSSMTESIQENLVKALDEINDADQRPSLEYRLGNLYFDEKNYSEADQFWKRALKKLKDDQTTAKSILEKLIEKNKENLPSSEDDSDNDDEEEEGNNEETTAADEENDEETAGADEENEAHSRVQSAKSQRPQSVKSQRPQSVKSQRPQSVKSQRPQSVKSQRPQTAKSTKSTNNQEKPEELAQAYSELEDHETALKYLKKYVLKLEDTLKSSWPSIEITDKKVPVFEFFHSLLLQTIASNESSLSKSEDDPNKDTWTNLLQAYKKIFTITVRLGNSTDEIGKANAATFQICQKLYNIPENLSKLYSLLFDDDLDDLEWHELIDLLSPDECTDILMRVAAYHVANDDDEKALKIYCDLQENIQDQETIKSAVNYGILKLFQICLPADEQYRTNIMAIDIHTADVPILDRILLCRLIISFWEELEDETMIAQFKTELFTLQNETWTVDNLETTDCIGKILTKFQDYAFGYRYWNEIRNIYNEMLTNSITTLLYSTDSTFEQIFRATHDMNNELADNIASLAESYELLATYEESDDCKEYACGSLEKGIVVYNKTPSGKTKIQELKAKLDTLKDEITHSH